MVLLMLIYAIYCLFGYFKYKYSFNFDKYTYIDNNQYKYILDDINKIYEKIKFNILFYDFRRRRLKLRKTIDEHNDKYINQELINQKEYFDKMQSFLLDEKQRRVILTDEVITLVVAGAGCGKTSTMVAKVKYLIDKKNIDPKEIMVISYTNNAVDNFKEKLNNDNVICTTFHKLGLDIKTINENKPDITTDLLNNVIEDYFKNSILDNYDNLKQLLDYYAYYLHAPISAKSFGNIIEQEKTYDLETIKSKLKTINNEKVKSYEEYVIANYLFMNGIRYQYEPSYKYKIADSFHRQYHPDFYLVDYDIYLEHFGINEDNRAPQYDQIEEKKYLDGIKFKREIHKKYKTKMIETYSFNFNKDIIQVLDDLMDENKIKKIKLNYQEIYKALIINGSSNELETFKKLIAKFITQYKSNNYDSSKFEEFKRTVIYKRSYEMLDLIQKIYNQYQCKLKDNNQIDFDDMINQSTEKVLNNEYNKKISYIIVDEYQDISYSRYLLLKSIQEYTKSKLICIGDDWQSIFRFSGSNINLFINFRNYFDNPKIMYINNTYRNSNELIYVAGQFIMKNEKGQLKKVLKSNKYINDPVEIFYYTDDIVEQTKKAIDLLKENGCKNIGILGRNNFDLKKYINNYQINFNVPYDLSKLFNFDVEFNTVHKSKGLEYDGVIICNMENSIVGFPNKIIDDPILDFVSGDEDSFEFAEERRLFYVALTRTKTKTILLVPEMKESVFVSELKNYLFVRSSNYKYDNSPTCPLCKTGKLVMRKNHLRGNYFVGCSNYPLCNYKLNNIEILSNPIKCSCGGFLVKKYDGLLGCTNYPYCHNRIAKEEK